MRALDIMDSRHKLPQHRLANMGMAHHSKAKVKVHIKAIISTRHRGLMGSMEDLDIEGNDPTAEGGFFCAG